MWIAQSFDALQFCTVKISATIKKHNLMKKQFTLIVIMLAFACIKLNAQNTFPASGSTGIGTSAPNASSILEVKSTTKGILTPRMTKAQRDLIASPATGLLIFQTNSTPGFYFFDGSVWKAVSSTSFPNKTLSNLTGPTKLNTDLLPDTSGTIDLGSSTKAWKDLYFDGDVYYLGSRAISFAGSGNTFVGFNAGNANTTGTANAFFGAIAGEANTIGASNSFFGPGAGDVNTTGSLNCFFGINAGGANTTASNNSFFGALAGNENTTGTSNAFFGAFAGQSNTTAIANSFFGTSAGSGNTTGESNSFFGKETGGGNTTGNENSFFGSNAGSVNSTGSNNVFIGSSAGFANSTASDNTFVGRLAGTANTTGTRNAFFGRNAGLANTTANDNSFFGAFAGDANTSGTQNSFFGSNSGGANSTGGSNSFYGFNSGLANTTGARNVFVGSNAGAANTLASDNSFLGANAGDVNTTGIQNSFFGSNAGGANTQASNNSFFGFTTGDNNTIGNFNAFFGAAAGTSNVNGNNNAFFGAGAGLSSTANDNSCFGTSAGEATTTGAENCFFGKDAGLANINGTGLVAYGFQAGKFRPGNSLCTFIGYQSDNITGTNFSNANAFGHLSKVNDFNQVRIGNTSIGSIGGFVGFTNVSDGRYKKNVKQNVPGLEFINKLNPVTYTLDVHGLQNFLHENDNLNEYVKSVNLKAADDKEKVVYTGFIAQEVEAVAKELNYDFSGVDKPNNEESLYGLRYAEFTVPLVKAVQELSMENDELKMEVESLKSDVRSLMSEVRGQRSEIRDQKSEISSALLGQNVPNPFDNSTIIPFRIPKECHSATIIIAESTGKIVRTIPVSCKETQLSLEAGALPNGIYSYSLVVDGITVETRQMILAK
jgi:hypothetical protein